MSSATTTDSLRALLLTDVESALVAAILADALEEAGDTALATYWRLVAARHLWPVKCGGPLYDWYEWWRWVDGADERFRDGHEVDGVYFDRLGRPTRSVGELTTKRYRSLRRALLALEAAWVAQHGEGVTDDG